MDALAKKPLGVNVGALVPFNPLRLYVMGLNDSRERVNATEKETKQMQAIVRESMEAGAFGWSSMKTLLNRPDDGRFIPSQVASNEEYLALAETMAEFGIGSIGWTRGQAERPLPPGEPDLMGGAGIEANAATGLQFDPVEGDVRGEGRDNFLIQMAKASGRPLNYGGVSYSEANPERYKEQLAYLERAHKEGANLFAQASGVQVSPVFELAEYNGFDALPNWIDPFIGTPEERIAKLNTPGVRDKMKQDVGGEWTGIGGTADVAANWTKMRVVEVRKDSNLQYEGMNIAELAEATGKHPMDAMLDLAIDEDLRTEFSTDPTTGTDPEAMKEILNHPYTHPCISDGGAHVRYLTVGIWPVNFLTMWARDHEAMSLEKAHYKMSGLPAFIAGFTDRGVLKEGFAADIIVYDLDKLGLQYDSPIYDDDFPGGERRLIQKAKGIRYTLVNGGVTFTEGTVCTDATPGKLLRSYDMVSR